MKGAFNPGLESSCRRATPAYSPALIGSTTRGAGRTALPAAADRFRDHMSNNIAFNQMR
jgi:hypothetical protein